MSSHSSSQTADLSTTKNEANASIPPNRAIMMGSTVSPGDSTLQDDGLATLPSVDFSALQKDMLSRLALGTGEWFFSSDMFQNWAIQKSASKTLWLTAELGVGKTGLTTRVIEELKKREQTTPGMFVAYVYCREFGLESVADLLLALIKQHLEHDPSVLNLIEPIIARHRRDHTIPSQKELLDVLQKISKQAGLTSFYVLEGLEAAPRDVSFDIFSAFASVDANFFVTSRPLPRQQNPIPNVEFHDYRAHSSDLRIIIDQTIDKHERVARLADNWKGLRDEIKAVISDTCNGNSLAAVLHTHLLNEALSVSGIRRIFNQPDTSIDALFQGHHLQVKRQREEHAAELAIEATAWVMFTREPLTLQDLRWALAFDPKEQRFDPDDLVPISILGTIFLHMLTVDPTTSQVRLLHHSGSESLMASATPDAEAIAKRQDKIASACINRLMTSGLATSDVTTVDQLDEVLDGTPLLRYAYKWWHYHVHASAVPAVLTRAHDFVSKCQTFPLSDKKWIDNGSTLVDRLSASHVAALYNFPQVIGTDVNEPAVLNAPTGSLAQRTPLMFAANNGLVDIAQQLVNTGVDVNAKDGEGNTALVYACHQGHEGVVRILLGVPGVDVNATNRDGHSALMVASREGYAEVVRLLLGAPGVQVNQS